MTRRDYIYKWAAYGLGLVLVWVPDAFVLSRFPVMGVCPTLLPLALAAVALQEGAFAGTGFGLTVGLLWELTYPGGFGGLVFGLALAGMIIGTLAQYALNQSFLGCLLCCAGLLGCLGALRVLRGLMTQAATLSVLLGVAIPECLLSLAWTPVVFLLFRAIFRRIKKLKN
jgi:rod shape-determining protein MreD